MFYKTFYGIKASHLTDIYFSRSHALDPGAVLYLAAEYDDKDLIVFGIEEYHENVNGCFQCRRFTSSYCC